MFALAVLDERAQRLLLARDEAGMKSLYWSFNESGFLFGSEIKALLAYELKAPVADPVAVRTYIRAGFVPVPRTGFQGIEKLPPGGWLVLESERVRHGHFWRPIWPARSDPSNPRRQESDYIRELERRLRSGCRFWTVRCSTTDCRCRRI